MPAYKLTAFDRGPAGNPLGTKKADPGLKTKPPASGGVSIMAKFTPDSRGFVDKAQLEKFIMDNLAGSSLIGTIPLDGAVYGIEEGTPEEWAHYLAELAGKESSYKVNTVGDVGLFDGNSNGLFQLSPNDATNYRFQDIPYTQSQLVDPEINTRAAIKIHERLLGQDRVIAADNRGAARYWGPLRRGWVPSRRKEKNVADAFV